MKYLPFQEAFHVNSPFFLICPPGVLGLVFYLLTCYFCSCLLHFLLFSPFRSSAMLLCAARHGKLRSPSASVSLLGVFRRCFLCSVFLKLHHYVTVFFYLQQLSFSVLLKYIRSVCTKEVRNNAQLGAWWHHCSSVR